MSHITDTELEELREALDYLWAVLPVPEVQALPDNVRQVCIDNHIWLNHSDQSVRVITRLEGVKRPNDT